ncbi:MAG TPA: AraC family transcriptional regulator [Tepidisphaeraceae bacterium]|jgi:AraC-like DNA-binding protein|nr:AraC family transcriptional regulator [Tepidisphaeraceae bacterium]
MNDKYLRETHMIGRRTRERIVGSSSYPALAKTGITLTGLSQAAVGFRFVRVSPLIVQVLVCEGGAGEVWVAGKWLLCGEGQAYVTGQRCPHGYRAIRGKVWSLAWVQYAGDAEDVVAEPRLQAVDPQPIASAIFGLYREWHGLADPAALSSWAHLVDLHARRILGPMEVDQRLSQLWETVATDLSRPWSLAMLADAARVSPEHLRRLCHARHGRSPLRHLAHLRLRRAAEQLASGRLKVSTVAAQVGYSNAFAFATAFRRELGISPSTCRVRVMS